MRQVPPVGAPPFGIVGDGRVARHFLHYFNLLGLPVRRWSRRGSPGDPMEALAPCRTVLILITDSAIVPFIEQWDGLRDKRLVHFSGSLVTNAAQAAHPLMTFGHDLYDRETYTAIPFVLDADGTPFHELFPDLPNPSFTIPVLDRPYYHALCVLAGNCSVLLWLKFFAELDHRWGIPASAGHPYLTQIAHNLRTNAGSALTGPLSRGDVDTLKTNLNALEGDPFRDVYAAFVRAYEHRS
jgi:2-dehydropantoate 2-reductase